MLVAVTGSTATEYRRWLERHGAQPVPATGRVGEPDLVVVTPDAPAAMLRAVEARRLRGLPFAVDLCGRVAYLEGDEIRAVAGGARVLFTERHEAAALSAKTGWPRREVLGRVGAWVVATPTARVETSAAPPVEVPGTGVPFRAAFLAALGRGLDHARAARAACAVPPRPRPAPDLPALIF